MKKIKYLLGILIMMPIIVNAETQLSISCGNEVIRPNSNIKCTITGNSSESISGLSAKLIVGDNLELDNVNIDSSWEGNGEGGSIDIYTDTNKTGNFPVATIELKTANVTEDFTSVIMLNNIVYSDANFQTIQGDSKELNLLIDVQEENEIPKDPIGENENINNTEDEKLPTSPETGIKDYLILALGIAMFAIIAFMLIKNKNKFFKL